MRSYIERAQDFVKEIYPYLQAFGYGYWGAKQAIKTFNEQTGRKVKFSHGCVRIAMITSDYVVKYDFDADEAACLGGGEDEVSFYEIAKAEGYAYLFAQVTRFVYEGHYFYIMPRIKGISERNYWHADHWMTPEEREWCDKHNLSDLHCNNYGFRNGKVCIIDYAYQWGKGEVSDS